MNLLSLLALLCAFETEPLARLDFAEPPPALALLAAGEGRALVADGVLALDLTAPAVGKSAAARLDLPIPVPCRVAWDQRLAVDSPHAYFAGVHLAGERGPGVEAALGGAGAQHKVRFPGAAAEVTPGEWLRCELIIEARRRSLRLTRRDGGEPVGEWAVDADTPRAPLTLTLWSNELPEKLPDGDAYAQSRGRHEFDNLTIERLIPPPPKPGEAYDRRVPIVFNRRLQWRITPAGPLAHDTGDLPLTGAEAVSDWVAGGAVAQQADGGATVFRRPHAGAVGPDRAVLRQLQFHLGQHPRLTWRLVPTNARARLLVTFTCPYLQHGIVLAETPWTDTAAAGVVDLPAELARWGEERSWAELDFVLDIDAPAGGADGAGEVAAELALPGVPAVVAPTHGVRAAGPVPLAAVVVGGEPTRVVATHTDPATPLALVDGLWQGELDLPAGAHPGEVVATLADGRTLRQRVELRVSGRPFVAARRGEPTYGLSDGGTLPPLLGDLFAWVPWDDPATPQRRMIRGLETLPPDAWPKLTKWRSMTAAEIDERVAYLHATGCRVFRLTPNTTPFESVLDAGGHVAPHGLEQLQRLLSALDRHGIRALINLFHYQYGSASTGRFPPYSAYRAAGYEGPEDWTRPATVALQRGYLGELLAAIGGDPAVLGYTLFGENDQIPGAEWVNSTSAFVKERAPRHLLVFEQGGGPQSHGGATPDRWSAFFPARDGGVGYRTYSSDGTPVDAYANLAARWHALDQPAFMAETCSGGPGWVPRAWAHDDFRTKLRDNLWASLLAPQAMHLTWSVCLLDAERALPTALAESIDWSTFRRARGEVAVVLAEAFKPALSTLAAVDDACARAGVTYDMLPPGADTAGYLQVIDAATPPGEVRLSDAVAARAWLRSGSGNAATLLVDTQRGLRAAYVRNSVEHRPGPGYGRGTLELHRRREAEREVILALPRLPAGAAVTVWDVDTGAVVHHGPLTDGVLALGTTRHDFALRVD